MAIKLLPGGDPKDHARMEKSVAIANDLDRFLAARKVTVGTVIEALGLIWATRAKTPEEATKFAADIATAISACFAGKEPAQ